MAPKTKVAAYLPMSTLLTALDHLKAVSVPNKIDGHTFPSMSSQLRSQLISGLRFFELIDSEGTPSPLLTELATKDASRNEIMKQLIETHYPDIVALDFAKITPKQLDEHLSTDKYGVQGDTKKKAKTFLLKAAQYAGFTVHPLLTKITRNRRPGGRRATSQRETPPGTRTGTATEDWRASNGQRFTPPADPDVKRMPIPLGPDRIAYVELPKDWDPERDAKKLLGVLRLSLDIAE